MISKTPEEVAAIFMGGHQRIQTEWGSKNIQGVAAMIRGAADKELLVVCEKALDCFDTLAANQERRDRLDKQGRDILRAAIKKVKEGD